MKAKNYYFRQTVGNILLLAIACVCFLVIAILVFGLAFTRILGSSHEQMKAIEAAALAGARSMSEVVIEDDNFGLIGLSDYAPVGAYTNAKDGYGTPVKGINTLLATVRVDMIIADQLDDDTLRGLCKKDYDNLMLAKDALVAELGRLTNSGQVGYDRNGNQISPYQVALDAYQSNQIRMTGESNSIVPGTFKLSLGCIKDLPTNTSIPVPYRYSAMTKGDQTRGKYLAYRNIAYDDLPFVLAGTGLSTALVESKNFQATVTDLPYTIPSIVCCEAQQRYSGSNLTGEATSRTIRTSACAQPGCSEDRNPYPGGLVFIFDDGNLPDLSRPASIFFSNQLKTSPADYFLTSTGGDFPPTPPTQTVHPLTGKKNPMMSEVMMLALYDWLRRAGSKPDIESFTTMLTTQFTAANASDIHSFQWTPAGAIDYKVVPNNPQKPYLPISENQWGAVSGLALLSSGKLLDVYISDCVARPGRTRGGAHAGEPLEISALNNATYTSPSIVTGINSLNTSKLYAEFPNGPGGGSIRPSYKENNVAVSVRFHFRK